jgi:hypothetical protein
MDKEVEDIIAEIEDSESLNRGFQLNRKIFSQVQYFHPLDKDGKELVDPVPIIDYLLSNKKILKNIVALGYVFIGGGLGSLSSSCPGYWLLLSYENTYRKFRIGFSEKDFKDNMKKLGIKVNQVYL